MFLGNNNEGDSVTGLYYSNHSGGCCGISVIHAFPNASGDESEYGFALSAEQRAEFLVAAIKGAIAQNRTTYPNLCKVEAEAQHHAIEIVLISDQLPYWGETLAVAGFKEVWSFLNSNSNNRCHVFFMETNA